MSELRKAALRLCEALADREREDNQRDAALNQMLRARKDLLAAKSDDELRDAAARFATHRREFLRLAVDGPASVEYAEAENAVVGLAAETVKTRHHGFRQGNSDVPQAHT